MRCLKTLSQYPSIKTTQPTAGTSQIAQKIDTFKPVPSTWEDHFFEENKPLHLEDAAKNHNILFSSFSLFCRIP
jgi:hypothetical protein